jgi:hypothetical protein
MGKKRQDMGQPSGMGGMGNAQPGWQPPTQPMQQIQPPAQTPQYERVRQPPQESWADYYSGGSPNPGGLDYSNSALPTEAGYDKAKDPNYRAIQQPMQQPQPAMQQPQPAMQQPQPAMQQQRRRNGFQNPDMGGMMNGFAQNPQALQSLISMLRGQGMQQSAPQQPAAPQGGGFLGNAYKQRFM